MELSRQRKWQLKKRAQGLCTICGKEPIFKSNQCKECYKKLLKHLADYYQKNKEKILERIAAYYQKNKEKIKEQHREKYLNRKKEGVK